MTQDLVTDNIQMNLVTEPVSQYSPAGPKLQADPRLHQTSKHPGEGVHPEEYISQPRCCARILRTTQCNLAEIISSVRKFFHGVNFKRKITRRTTGAKGNKFLQVIASFKKIQIASNI